MSLNDSIGVSASGLRAQSMRMRIVAENLANADSVATRPGGDPYRRKAPAFVPRIDRASGATQVKVDSVAADRTPFPRVYDPGNPAAGPDGYVLKPNVNTLIEGADMKAAQRSYQANLNAIEAARSMTMRTLDLLK
jgi:flagellar basal-body rod protein FlgC